jgi:uncharacterized protein
VGWIFSTVGAFGGIMAGVGHMTIYGLGPYAGTFRQTIPALNRTLTDSIRTSNQFLVGLSALDQHHQLPEGKTACLAPGPRPCIGSIAGALLIPWLTGGKITFQAIPGVVRRVRPGGGFVLIWETTSKGQQSKKAAKRRPRPLRRA